MQCATHPTEAATAICTRCDKLLCAACAKDHNGKNFCADCAEFLAQRVQQRQAVAPSAPAGGAPTEIYQGPPAGDVSQGPPAGDVYQGAPADVYQGPPPASAPRQPTMPRPQPSPTPAAAPRPPAANPYQSAAPAVERTPTAANPHASPAPANPYASMAPAATSPQTSTTPGPPTDQTANPRQGPVNPYQATAPGASPSSPANPHQASAPPAAVPQEEGSIGLAATPPPLAPASGDVYQGPPADVYQGPPGDVYQGPPGEGMPGDVYQGPPEGDVYQGPPADGVYQGATAAQSQPMITVSAAEDEGSMGRALAFGVGFGLLAVLIWYGFSESTDGMMKAPLIGSFLGLVIGHSAVRGAGRGGSDVAMLSAGLTVGALVLGEVLIGYQPERMFIEMGFWEWVLYLISLYEGWNVPASRA